MKVYKRLSFATITISLSLLITSCAVQMKHSFKYSGSNYGDVFQASMHAADDINFSVVSSDIESGVIVAEKPYITGDSMNSAVYRLNISIKNVSAGVAVGVTSVAPPMASGDGKDSLQSFIKALRKRVPYHLKGVSLK